MLGLGDVGKTDVDHALTYVIHHPRPVGRLQFDAQIRASLRQNSHRAHARNVGWVGRQGETDLTGFHALGQSKFAGEIVKLGQRAITVFDYYLAEQRWRHALAVEQFDAELALELLQAARERWLRHAERLCS